MTYYGRWTYKYEEAARQGAAAALIVHETEPAAYGWNVVQSSWTGAAIQSGRSRQPYGPVEGDRLADQRRGAAAVRRLRARTSTRSPPRPSGQGFKRGAARTPGVGHARPTQIKRQASKNVIGILPGTKRPDEYVLYTAHWDHLGRCDADPTATTSATARSTMPPAPPAWSRWPRPMPRRGNRRPLDRLPRGHRRGIGPARLANIMPRTRSIRSRRRSAVNMDGLNVVGDTRDFVVDRQRASPSSRII